MSTACPPHDAVKALICAALIVAAWTPSFAQRVPRAAPATTPPDARPEPASTESAAPAWTPPDVPSLSGPGLTAALDRAVLNWSWTNRPFRSIIEQLEQQLRVAILIDRRINPDQLLTIQLQNLSTREAISELARQVGAEMRQVGSTVYIGPGESCRDIRTLIELRRQELAGLPIALRQKYSVERVFGWSDLTTPSEVLTSLQTAFNTPATSDSRLPHDLLRGEFTGPSNLIEATSLFLIQFRFTFSWSDPDRGLRLLPLTSSPQLTRQIRVPAGKGRELAEQWRSELPGLELSVEGQTIQATGNLDDLEHLERLRQGRDDAHRVKGPPVVPLAQRTFTLRIRDVPARALMDKLEQSGIRFEYDQAALRQAQVDLMTRIEFEVRDASPRQFFHELFDPLSIQFEISGNTVKLAPGQN